MKSLIQFWSVLLLVVLVVSVAHGTTKPFLPEIDVRFNTLEALPSSVGMTTNGIANLRVARFQYDFATNGGTIGTKNLGVSLPANAIIWAGMFFIDTQFTGGGGATVALKCGSATFFAATGITGYAASSFHAIVPVGSAATAQDVVTACDISSVHATANTTAGKLTGWLFYFVHS